MTTELEIHIAGEDERMAVVRIERDAAERFRAPFAVASYCVGGLPAAFTRSWTW